MRLAIFVSLATLATLVAITAISTNELRLWAAVGVLASAAVALGISIFNRWDALGDQTQARTEITTLLAAEMHNFTRQHARNISKLTELISAPRKKRDIVEAVERFSFKLRPSSKEEELFKISSVEQISHLPKYLALDFMRVHIFARNVEMDIERTLDVIQQVDENDEKFVEVVTDELYRIGSRIERAAVQGELLLQRLEAYKRRNAIARFLQLWIARLTQNRFVRQFIYTDRPIQPDDTRAYEELSAWRELLRVRHSTPDCDIIQIAKQATGGLDARIANTKIGTFNHIYAVDIGSGLVCVRRRINGAMFRYNKNQFMDVFVSHLYRNTRADEVVDRDSVQKAIQYSQSINGRFVAGVHEKDYPGPQLFGFGAQNGNQYVVSEWLVGDTAGRFSTASNYHELGASVARMHGRRFLHAMPTENYVGLSARQYLEAIKKEIIERNDSGGEIVERGQIVEWIEKRLLLCNCFSRDLFAFVVCHNDLHPYNLFSQDGIIRIVDWDNVVIAHPYLDFVKPRYWSGVDGDKMIGSEENFENFIRGYADATIHQAPKKFMNIRSNPMFQLHKMLWLLRIWTFETARKSKGISDLSPFQSPEYYEPLIWKLAELKCRGEE